mmetsp:Transcript_70958/g.154186  ORF Transcript_70958/g.154186 Transcript_70958/m.154186 type:complete len:242 (+) Transcript_70958:60-785(+)|eukprot:CAMPEP_0170600068 /NCGR_PEP_ID=MMETSP0224-20130122/17140_1 /TAXON_ID=285029 /ORGANISM="Togula jolla, Strain CCCM 725" /LENGTH=241 /DNA_ID=CAMNT_0010924775 /DNA_START=207 /DNA_END=932 /DNA_ORIENTATION=+
MGERAAVTRLRREYGHILEQKIPHIVAKPTEKNLLVWFYVLHDLPAETPYVGGVYWGRLVFPREYPLKPPSIYMLTPSGRFETNSRLCLSMSDFHPESWNPSWRIESILLGLVSFMLDTAEPRTTGGLHSSFAYRQGLAKASFEYNRGHAEFRELFPEFCDEAKLHPSGAFFLAEPEPAALKALSGTNPPPEGPPRTTDAEGAPAGRRDLPDAQGLTALALGFSAVMILISGIAFYAAQAG